VRDWIEPPHDRFTDLSAVDRGAFSVTASQDQMLNNLSDNLTSYVYQLGRYVTSDDCFCHGDQRVQNALLTPLIDGRR
jgi:hypothetical protein